MTFFGDRSFSRVLKLLNQIVQGRLKARLTPVTRNDLCRAAE